MKNIGFKKLFFQSLAMLLFLIIGTGCTSKHGLYVLSTGDDAAFIRPTDGLRILKIDDTLLNIIPDGGWAFKFEKKKYSSVSIVPGHHKVVVRSEHFGDGSVYFLEADFQKNRLYNVKFDVINRLPGENIWVVKVWIEDSVNKKTISKIIKNI